jgi:hypothetical protein
MPKNLRITVTKDLKTFCKGILKKSGAIYLNSTGLHFELYGKDANVTSTYKIENPDALFISDYDRSLINLIADAQVDTNIVLTTQRDSNTYLKEANLYMHRVNYVTWYKNTGKRGLLYATVAPLETDVY